VGTIEEDAMTDKIEQSHTDFIDNLDFEDTVKQTAILKAIILNAAETNQTKIEFLKEELMAGRYQINSNRIAAKMVEQVSEEVVKAPAETA
jgi:flagellar biosynthesis anti-sigma factor FlgM